MHSVLITAAEYRRNRSEIPKWKLGEWEKVRVYLF